VHGIKKDKSINSPTILNLTSRFNKISYWIATEIVSIQNPEDRVTILSKCIQLADILFGLNNFSGTMAIYCALNLGAIQRLKSTWKRLPEKYIKRMKEFDRVLDPSCNYKNYREHLSNVKLNSTPIIPFYGIILSDLTTAEEIPDTKDNGHINFEKMRVLAKVFREIEVHQQVHFNFVPLSFIEEYLNNLQPKSEAELYELSKQCTALEVQSTSQSIINTETKRPPSRPSSGNYTEKSMQVTTEVEQHKEKKNEKKKLVSSSPLSPRQKRASTMTEKRSNESGE